MFTAFARALTRSSVTNITRIREDGTRSRRALVSMLLTPLLMPSVGSAQQQHVFGMNLVLVCADVVYPGDQGSCTVLLENNDQAHAVIILALTVQAPFGVPGFPDGVVQTITSCVDPDGNPLGAPPFELSAQDGDSGGGTDSAVCVFGDAIPADPAICGGYWASRVTVSFEDADFPEVIAFDNTESFSMVQCICGDGIVNMPGEECDDANENELDGCSAECLLLECAADLTGDGEINAADLAQLLSAWGPQTDHPADLNLNGTVNAVDLALLIGTWGSCG